MTRRQRRAVEQHRKFCPESAIFVNEADEQLYLDALYDFQDDLDRARYARRLLALGVHREAIEWHLNNPGEGRSGVL